MTYETDYYANNPANLIIRQPLSIMKVPELKAAIIIPTTTPFYAKDHELWYKAPGQTGTGTRLTLGVDYFFGGEFRSASKSTQHAIYSLIFLTDQTRNGSVEFTHRTVGTEWSRDVNELYGRLIAQSIHPRKTTYENIAALPVAFPVIQHPHPVEEMYYTEDVINALNAIATAINNRPNDTVSQVFNLLMASLTKSNIGLGNVPNYSPPTAGVISAATSATHFATINAVSQIVEARLAAMGFGGQTGPTQPIDQNAVISSATTSVDSELFIADGTSGKNAKLTAGLITLLLGGAKTSLQMRSGSGNGGASIIAREFGGSGRTIELAFPTVFTNGSYSVSMPAAAGTLMRVEEMQIPAGQVPYNAGVASGLPNSALAISSARIPGALVRYDSNGRFTVVDPANPLDPANKQWSESQFVLKTDNTYFRTTSVIQQAAVPSASTVYSSQAVQALLEGFVTEDELADVIAALNVGETGASALTVTQLTMGTAGATYDLIADTINILAVNQSGTVRFPDSPPTGSVVGVMVSSMGAGVVLTVNTRVAILGSAATTFTTRTPNEYFYFQYTSAGRWARVQQGEYFSDTKSSTSTITRYRGSVSALPDHTVYGLGDTLRLTANVVVGDITWRANSIVTRGEAGWIYSHNGDQTELEEMYDVLIAGFTNLNAAL